MDDRKFLALALRLIERDMKEIKGKLSSIDIALQNSVASKESLKESDAENSEHFRLIEKSMLLFVTQEQFNPVKQIVYGIATISLLAVFGAIVKLVVVQ